MIFSPYESNLHTHSHYCGHGSGTPQEYALASELRLLGFTEHAPTYDNRYPSSRMKYEQMPFYEADVRAIDQEGLTVLLGYECDYLPEYYSYFDELRARVDYLIFGVHDLDRGRGEDSLFHRRLYKEDLLLYTKRYIQSIESGHFLFGAHPDVFASNYHQWDDEAIACSKAIIECAIEYGVGLEINGNGMRKALVTVNGVSRYAYPLTEFWVLASEYSNLKVVVSSDAHRPSDVMANIDDGITLAGEAGVGLSSYRIDKGGGDGSTLSIDLYP